MKHTGLRFALVLAVVWTRSPASAQPSTAALPTHLTLIQDACAAQYYAPDELKALLQLELQQLGLSQLNEAESLATVDAAQSGLAIVHLACDPVRVELSDFATGKQLTRELLLDDMDETARPRALALVVVLLIQDSWLELATEPEPGRLPQSIRERLRQRLRAQLELPATAAPPPTAAAQRPPTMALAAFGVARTFPSRNTGLVGADVMFMPMLGPLRVALDVETLIGRQEVSDAQGPIARATLFSLSGGLTLMWASATRPELSVGPFVRVGYGLARGESERQGTPSSDGSVIAALGVAASLRAAVAAGLDVWAGADLGYVPVGVLFLVDRARLGGMAEVTLSLRAGVGRSF